MQILRQANTISHHSKNEHNTFAEMPRKHKEKQSSDVGATPRVGLQGKIQSQQYIMPYILPAIRNFPNILPKPAGGSFAQIPVPQYDVRPKKRLREIRPKPCFESDKQDQSEIVQKKKKQVRNAIPRKSHAQHITYKKSNSWQVQLPKWPEVSYATDDELMTAKAMFPPCMTRNKRKELERHCISTFRESMDLNVFDKVVCGVCGKKSWGGKAMALKLLGEKNELLRWKNKMEVSKKLFVYSQYPILSNMVILRKSIDEERQNIVLCESCNDALLSNMTPQNAMCFGLYRDVTPELTAMTLAEKSLIAIYRPYVKLLTLRQVNGKTQQTVAFRGNACTYEQDQGVVVSTLFPRAMSSLANIIHVIFVGNKSAIKKETLMKLLQKQLLVRVWVVYEWLFFLKAYNHLYEHIVLEDMEVYSKKSVNKLSTFDIPCSLDENITYQDELKEDLQASYIPDGDVCDAPDNEHFSFHSLCSSDINGSKQTSEGGFDILNRLLKHRQDDNEIYVAQSPQLGSRYDEFYFEKAFPCLFPYGIGGPKSLHCSLNAWAEFVLDDYQSELEERSFQTNDTFLSLLYSNIQAQQVDTAIMIEMKRPLNTSHETLKAELDTIEENDLLNMKHLIENGKIYSYVSIHYVIGNIRQCLKEPCYKTIMKCINRFGHNILGTTAQREQERRQALAIIQMKRMPSMFFTANFDDRYHPLVAKIAGFNIEFSDVYLAKPDVQKRREISRTNHVAVADFAFFSLLMMLRHLFGYDLVQLKPVQGGGLFGYPEDIMGFFHDQGRGGLHVHFLVWIVGHESPMKMQEKIKEAVYASQYLKFVDQCFHTSPEGYEHYLDSISSCTPRHWDYKKPTSLDDPQFDKRYTDDENRITKQLLCHTHTFTCLKKLDAGQYREATKNFPQSADGYCRLGCPWQLYPTTHFSENGNLRLKRTMERTVETNSIVSTELQMNSCGHFMDCGKDGLISVLYSANYMANSHAMDPFLWDQLVQVFKRYDDNKNDDPEKLVLKQIIYTFLRNQQTSLSMLALHVRKYPSFFNSVAISTVYSYEFARYFDDPTITWVGMSSRRNQVINYEQRCKLTDLTTSHLKNCCPVLFCRWYTIGIDGKNHKLSTPLLPILYRPDDIPVFRIENIKDVDDIEIALAKIIALLFTPWNEIQDVSLDMQEKAFNILTKQHYYADLEDIDVSFLDQCIDSICEYSQAKLAIKEYQLHHHEIPGNRHHETFSGEDILDSNSDDDEIDESTAIDFNVNKLKDSEVSHIYRPSMNSTENGLFGNWLNIHADHNTIRLGPTETLSSNFSIDEKANLIFSQEVKQYLKQWQQRTINEKAENIGNITYAIEQFALTKVPNDDDWCNLDFQTICLHVCTQYTLSPDQILVFYVYAAQIARKKHNLSSKPIQMIVFGNAGSGKSHIIKAIEEFYAYHNCSDLIEKCAYTGPAAANIGGSTIHHLYQWRGISTKPSSLHTELERIIRNQIWKGINLQIIDEFGNIDGKTLYAMDETSKLYRENVNSSFGGLNMLFLGDPQQLPPVRKKSLFHHWDVTSKRMTTSTQNHVLGQVIWHGIPYAVEIEGFKRFSCQYAKYLIHLLQGPDHISNDELRMMQSRQLKNVSTKEIATFQNAQTIVATNALRVNINEQYTELYAKRHNQEICHCVAIDVTHQKSVNMHILRAQNASKSEMKTYDLPHSIPLVIGMEYALTMNQIPKYNLAKGSIFTLIKIHGHKNRPDFLEMKSSQSNELFRHWPQGIGMSNHCTVHRETVKMSLPYSDDGIKSTSVSFERCQFPLVPAIAFTNYRAQGQTIHQVITSLRNVTSRPAKYVQQSRNKDDKDILLLDETDLTKLDLAGKPDILIDDELKRLRQLSVKTYRDIWNEFPSRLFTFYEEAISHISC